LFKKLISFLSDSLTFGLGGILAQLIGFVLLPVYTRYLNPTDYGIIAMLSIIIAVFITVSGLGTNEAIFKYYRDSKINNNQLISNAFLIVFLSASLLLLIGLLSRQFILKVLLEDNTINGFLMIDLSLLIAFFMSLNSVFNSLVRAERRVKVALLVNVIFVIVQISISMVAIIFYELGVLGMVLGQFFGQILVFIILVTITFKDYEFDLNKLLSKKMIKYGVFSVPTQLMDTIMNQLAQFMIKSTLTLKESGLNAIATRITVPIQIVGSSMRYAHSGFFFQILNEEKEPTKLLRALASFYIALLTYLWVGVAIWGIEVLKILTPIEFHSAHILIAPLAIIPLLLIIYTFISSGIDSGKDLKPYLVVNGVGLVTYLVSLYFLLMKFGVIGAAYATIITRLIMIVVSNYFSQKRLKVPYNSFSIILLISAGFLVIYINHFFYEENIKIRLLVEIIISLLFPVICIIILSFFNIERKQIFNTFKSIKTYLKNK
jgi:O-antigen/teichoic acid export membrane protein